MILYTSKSSASMKFLNNFVYGPGSAQELGVSAVRTILSCSRMWATE